MGEQLSQGYVLLDDALLREARDSLNEALEDAQWTAQYSPDLHRYEETDPSVANDIVEQLLAYFSRAIGEKNVLDVKVRRYSVGSYTLQHDEQKPAGLHVTLFLCDGWEAGYRGEHTFVPEKGDPLLVLPKDGSVIAVSVPEGTRRFVKRVTHLAGEDEYVSVEFVLTD